MAAAAFALPSGASADPTNPANMSLSQAQAALSTIQQQQEGAVETFNQATSQAAAAQTDVAAAQAAVTKEQQAYTDQAAATTKLAAAQYESGGVADSLVAMVSATNPDAYLNAAALTSQVDRDRAHALVALKTSKTRLDGAKQVAEAKQTAAASLASQAQTAQQAIDAKVAEAQHLVDNLNEQAKQALQAQQQAEAAAADAARQAAAAQAATVRAASVTPTAPVAAAPVGSGRAAAAIQAAYAELGAPYSYGAAGPSSFDCSGLMQWVWAKAGVSLPRTATAQYYATQRISAGDLQPGDLIFFNFGGSSIEHVGMYVGNGNMIDAPHTGSYVGVRAIYSGVFGYGRV